MFRKGFSYSFPIVAGYLPVSMTFGILAVTLGFSKTEAILTSALIFAGSSQFALISILPESFLSGVIIPIILNLRHLVYSSILSQKFEIKKASITAFGLTDEVFATSVNTRGDERFIWGLEAGSYISWVGGTALGVFTGSALSDDAIASALVFSLPVLFLVLLLPNLKEYSTLAAFFGGAIALSFHFIGMSSAGILLAGILSPALVMKLRRMMG